MDSPTPTRRDLKLASWEVVPTAGWLHLTRDTFLKSFLLDRGVSHLFIALADNFPAIAQMIQPLAAWALAAMGRFRRVVVLAFLLERLLVALPLLLAVALSWEKLPRWVLPAMATSYLVGSVAANGWLTWIGRLTDGQGRSAFLSRRSQREALTNAVLGPVAAAGLDWAIRHGRANLGYGAVFGVALMSGLISLLLIRRIDPATAPARDPNLPPLSRLLAPLRDPGYRRFLRFAGLLTIGQTLSHPFWTVYQLAVLHWTVLEVTLYNMAATLVAMAWYPVWGRLADRVGTTPLLRTLLLFRVVNPILWLFLTPDNAWWILAPEAM
ncbi:MAG TPA: hypothetical protein VEI97_04560, partial [bacterium]|nr:hypothetical protein [bacterium]